jgi:hypothetical protein
VESLPSELDDNVLPPLVAAAALALLLPCRAGFADAVEPAGLRGFAVALGINAAVAGLAALLGVVRPSGALAGALLGAVVLGLGGAGLYLLLWAFFLGGTLATRFRRARKEAMGKAEERGGRRGAANVLANVSVPAFCALAAGLGPQGGALRLAAAAALATALMDTVGTEVGQAFVSPTVLLPDFRRVPPGTEAPCRSRAHWPASPWQGSSRGQEWRPSSSRPPALPRSSSPPFSGPCSRACSAARARRGVSRTATS